MPRFILAAFLVLAATVFSTHGSANCGQAVCAVNTDWEVQGVLLDGKTRLDVRFEYIDQDHRRRGSQKVPPDEVTGHHDEVRTINRNWIATLDHSFNSQWGLSLALPYSSRTHHHIHHHLGEDLPEAWSYQEMGDARILGRYQANAPEGAAFSWGLSAGLKLPTGKHDVRNDEGELAERTLQPGTGTTDWIAGVFVHRAMQTVDTFAQIQIQRPFAEREHFQPGTRTSIDIGLRYPLGERIALLAQLNLLHRGHDQSEEAEAEDSGGKFVYFSPGISVSASRNVRLYAFLQLPLYQHANGIQLAADWAASAGISMRF
ncbi:MAG: hypothetical protein ACKVQA_21330 [Burkholderiales bacterium]